MNGSDFWWLPEKESSQAWLVGVGHRSPLSDDDGPYDVPWYRSVDPRGELSTDEKRYPLAYLDEWRRTCGNSEVFRTLKLYASPGAQEAALLGPFLIDVDNSAWNNGYREDLEDALRVTRQVVRFVGDYWNLSGHQFRIFFTGRKGFNVEIRPDALEIGGPVASQVQLSLEKLQTMIYHLHSLNGNRNKNDNAVSDRGTVIDRIYGSPLSSPRLKHPYVRLHDSVNKWVTHDGTEIARMKLELSPKELFDSTARAICSRSESMIRQGATP
jgi:hypothetical protein